MRSSLRRWVVLPAAALALWLATACGGPAVGDVEGQVLAMRDPAQPPVLLKGANVILAGNRIDCAKRADHCAAQTDDQGKYRFADVPTGEYGIAFSVPPREGEPPLQPESRQFTVSGGAVETVSVVLLAEGIARPATPPPELVQLGAAARNDPGLTSNPFFWYWMFNQPWVFGYPRPPVVVYAPGPERTVVVDRNQPAAPSVPGRTYSSYGPPGTAGTKPAPQPIESKGVTRPGGSAVLPSTSGSAGSLPDASKGVSRPGQALAGSDATAPQASSGSGGGSAARAADRTSPSRISPGGSTARRSPIRSASPPRVRIGRR